MQSPVIEIQRAGAAWSVVPKAWETEFFDRSIASLVWSPRSSGATPTDEVAAVRESVDAADAAGVDLLECHLDTSDVELAPTLEAAGFRLVDSRIRFLSRMTADEVSAPAPRRGQIRDAAPDDFDRILELTHLCFTNNPGFVSRFKNRDYFTPDDSRRYFAAWAHNTAFADDARSAVFVVEDHVVGFYTYQVTDQHDGAPVLKGILTGVEPAARGANAQLAMQDHLYARFGFDEWWLDNLTQLTNLHVIRNHVRSAKHLESVHLTFYRRGRSGS